MNYPFNLKIKLDFCHINEGRATQPRHYHTRPVEKPKGL